MSAHAVSAADLPDDIDALKGLVIAQAAREREYETELQCLREQLNLLLAKRFVPSSEKVSPDQLRLFYRGAARHGARAGARCDSCGHRPLAQTRRPQGARAVPAASTYRA